MKTFIVVFLMLTSLITFSQTGKDVDATTFKELIESNKGILIDLRTPDEIKNKGKIKNAIEIDFLSKNAEETVKKLDKKKTYLIYCAGGGRSGDCKELMLAEGFTEVINLDKGFDDWKAKGLEIEKKE